MMVTTGGRGCQFGVGVGSALQPHLHIGFRDAPRAVAELLHHQFGGVGVQRLRDGGHHAQLHQRLDHLAGAGGHAVGQFLHGDRVRQDDVAHHLHLIGAQPLELGLAALALALAPHRGQRADPLVLALDRGLHVDAAGAAAVVGPSSARPPAACAAACRRRRGDGPAGPRRRPPRPSRRARSRSVSVGVGWRCAGRGAPATDAGAARPGARAVARTAGLGGGHLRRDRRLGGLRARPPRPFAAALSSSPAARLLLGGLARLLLAAARFLGGRQDRNLLLLAPFRLALGRLALLLHQRALARRQFGRGQRPAGARQADARRARGPPRGRRRLCRAADRPARRACRRARASCAPPPARPSTGRG